MRCVFIVPYFGRFPNHFNLLLRTCESNQDYFDWVFITDDHGKYKWKKNTFVKYMSFNELQKHVQSKFDFPIVLNKPYKLCDYKPAYGYLFEEYISGYDFWGHIDIDCLYGDFSRFIDKKCEDYDKLLRLGHLTLYKNTWENNRRFMKPVNGIERYREVYSTFESCMFDEANCKGYLSIEDIWREHGYKEYDFDNKIANIWYKGCTFRVTCQKEGNRYEVEKPSRSIFYWKDGSIIRLFLNGDTLKSKEYMYMHFMARNMKDSTMNDSDKHIVKIIPNEFVAVDSIPKTVKQFNKEKWINFNIQYITSRSRNLRTKILQRFKGKEFNGR